MAVNFGNNKGIIIKTEANCTYTELITQSAIMPCRSEIFRFISNSWENMPNELIYKWRDSSGGFPEPKRISLVTNRWGKNIVPDKVVNDVRISKTIDGNSTFKINMPPKSKVELIIIEKQ